MSQIETDNKCRNCFFYRPRIGKTDPELCRAPFGMLLGSKNPEDDCVKPEYFTPKDVPASTMPSHLIINMDVYTGE